MDIQTKNYDSIDSSMIESEKKNQVSKSELVPD